MINNVSFGAISTNPTSLLSDEIINQPGAYAAQPAAAAGVNGDKFEKKGGTAKKIVGAVAIIAAVAAAIALGAKKLPNMEKAPAFLKNLFAEDKIMGKIGNFIADKASIAYNFVKSHIPFLNRAAKDNSENLLEGAGEAIGQMVEKTT